MAAALQEGSMPPTQSPLESKSQTPLQSTDDTSRNSTTTLTDPTDHAFRHPHFGKNEKDDASQVPGAKKRELTENDCYDQLGFSFPSWKKWTILSIIFIVQVSMNFNTSLYSNGLDGISKEFNVSLQAARCGAMIFLVLYAFGCELWAPWSEEIGRKITLQTSLLFVNIFQLPVALAPNFTSVMIGRALGGLASAGGSVTLGMVADMWESDDQQYAVAFVVFSSVGGSVVGPIVGGFVEQNLNWRWCIWLQLIFGVFVQFLHLVFVPETRTTVMMDRIAKKMRESGEDPNVYGPNENIPFRERFSVHEILALWLRPFKMFVTEPIVLTLSLLSGFSDALIFMFIQSFSIVYKQWGFDSVEIGLSFIAILIGYTIAYLSFIPAIKRNIRERHAKPGDEKAQYESRLWWLLYTVPALPIGLIGFAWTSTGPPLPWAASMVFVAIVGIANYSIYMATIDYMICAYGPYSASATGGNGWARDFLAGVLTIPATPFFTNLSPDPSKALAYASTILFCISFILVIAVYVIYFYGPVLRKRSPFAQQLKDKSAVSSSGRPSNTKSTSSSHTTADRPVSMKNSVHGSLGGDETHVGAGTGAGLNRTPTYARQNSNARLEQEQRIRRTMGSRQQSRAGTPSNSRPQSRRTSMETPAKTEMNRFAENSAV